MARLIRSLSFSTVVRAGVGIAILWMGTLMVNGFSNYFPPNFSDGFLRGKQAFFYDSGYAIGFYAHIVASPITLACGVLQMSTTLRQWKPHWHRRVGSVYVWLVLVAAAPGGFIMALRAYGDWSSTICFGTIAVVAWGSTLQAWRCARAGRFAEHGRWMIRSYVMISSAVSLRLVSIAVAECGLDHKTAYQVSAWLSWLPTFVVTELWLRLRSR